MWPSTLTINAWTGRGPVAGAIAQRALDWALGPNRPNVQQFLKLTAEVDLADWRDPSVGWGLILMEKPGLSQQQLATGTDAPEPIQAVLKARHAPVFRYRPDSPDRFTLLRNYAAWADISIDPGTPTGMADDALPQYLLIYGSPEDIPWEFQYILNSVCAVGRLDLRGEALEHYVQALLCNWQDASAQIDQAVVWSVDYGGGDITQLMHDAIAVKVYQRWHQDTTLCDRAIFLDGEQPQGATVGRLISTLAARKPALIVTTSHGQTGPLNDPAAMMAMLGLPIDQNRQALSPTNLLADWEPDGAIWYAHACCSAGSSAQTIYNGLVDSGSIIDQVLNGVARLGAHVAPLPTALLGARRPLRAFIGHVEPTFDWTLRQPATGQHLTNGIVKALYDHIYRSQPVGLAFSGYYKPLGTLSTQYQQAFTNLQAGQDRQDTLLYCQLAARDLQSMVILGDPTAALPALP